MNFEFASIVRGTTSATQANECTNHAAPEVLEEAGTITQEADVFAFGMVVIEVCPRALPHLALKVDKWIIRLTPEYYLRFLREEVHSVNSQLRSSLQR